MKKGKLYLLPCPLGENALHTVPPYAVEIMHRLDYFICERPKTARHFIKATGIERPLPEITWYELGKRIDKKQKQNYLNVAERGHDIGLLSEAGCPGVADPGAEVVTLAHERGIEVVPIVGPSSILLAVMASGMNGQNFAFNGYLGVKKPDLVRDLKRLEQDAKKRKQTQIFIETPYRNNALVETAIQTLAANTRFGVAVDLTLNTEKIIVKQAGDWKKGKLPDLHKRPAIFMIG